MQGSRVEILARRDECAYTLVSDHISSVRNLSRCRDVSVIAAGEASGTIEDEDSQICLARQILSTRDNGAITIRVVLPPTVAVASAVANARAEIKRLNTKLGKSAAQLEKLKALTSRSTYVEMSPRRTGQARSKN